MAGNAPWWTQLPNKTGKDPEPFQPADRSKKGQHLGECFHITCTRTGADWYNKVNRRYFCEVCATAINDACVAHGQAEVCQPRS